MVSATGPYKAVSVKTDSGITLVKNDNYWDGEPKIDKIVVEHISDGDTLTMALQSGELDAAYGLPYCKCIHCLRRIRTIQYHNVKLHAHFLLQMNIWQQRVLRMPMSEKL